MKSNNLKVLFFLISIVQLAFSQQLPIDFSDSSDNFNFWGGSTFAIIASPTDSNNSVGQFERSNSSSEQGCYIDLNRSVNLDTENTITLMFYAFDPNSHTIIIKLENGVNSNIELGVTTSSQNSWTELTYDFSTIGGSGAYDRLTIRIDDGSTTPGTFLIDDIHDGSIPTDPNELDVIYTDLVWADEFDTPGDVNQSKWHKQTQAIIPGFGWANNEEQHYTDRLDNSFVDNSGNLNIVAKRETYTSPQPENITKSYTSARLNSKFAFTYGRIDVKAKLPAWDGTWPAIWTLGKNINEDGGFWDAGPVATSNSANWPQCGEIDIMEHGLGPINHTSSAIHTNSSSGATINYRSQVISDVAANWHIYSVNWSPNQITFLVDDVPYYTYNPAVKNLDTWPFTEDQYILLNVAMGGISGSIDSAVSSGTMLIDYVRIYQNNSLSLDEKKINNFRIYPNPANEIINIKTQNNIDLVEVYDVFGKLIISQSEQVNTINVENLDSGLYLLNIYAEGIKTIKKVIVN